jgi:hypothetical protein
MTITVNKSKYVVNTKLIDTNSNYNLAISVKRPKEKYPIWGTITKEGNDLREIAKSIIDLWIKTNNI